MPVNNLGEYIYYIHRHPDYGLDIWSLNRLLNQAPHYPFKDKIWAFMNENCMQGLANYEIGTYIFGRRDMANFLSEEKKYKEALYHYSEVILFESCLIIDQWTMKRYLDLLSQDMTNEYKLYSKNLVLSHMFQSDISLTPIIRRSMEKDIRRIVKGLRVSDIELRTMLEEYLTEHIDRFKSTKYFPYQKFTIHEIIEIVISLLNDNISKMTEINNNAKKRFEVEMANL